MMLNLSNMSIGKKLNISYIICIASVCIMCVFLLISFILVKSNLDKINKVNVTGLEQTYIAASSVTELTRIFGLAPFLPEADLDNEMKKIPILRDKYKNALEIVKKTNCKRERKRAAGKSSCPDKDNRR